MASRLLCLQVRLMHATCSVIRLQGTKKLLEELTDQLFLHKLCFVPSIFMYLSRLFAIVAHTLLTVLISSLAPRHRGSHGVFCTSSERPTSPLNCTNACAAGLSNPETMCVRLTRVSRTGQAGVYSVNGLHPLIYLCQDRAFFTREAPL